MLNARAIDAAGDSVPDATVVWELLLPDSGEAEFGFELDSTTGLVRGLYPGSGRVRARVDELRSDTISIVVTAAPDSIAADGDTVINMDAGAAVSPPMATKIFDYTTDPDSIRTLPEKNVTYSLIDPVPGHVDAQGFFLTEADSVPGTDPHSVAAVTDGSGVASIVVRRISGQALPDSAVVAAFAVTAVGDTVNGSPVRFTIVFESVP